MLESVGVGSNCIPHKQLLLGPLLRPGSVPTDSTALDTGSRAFGSGNCGYLECCPEVGREEWALIRQHSLAPHTLCLLGKGESELGTLKWESLDSWSSYWGQRTKLVRKSLTQVI